MKRLFLVLAVVALVAASCADDVSNTTTNAPTPTTTTTTSLPPPATTVPQATTTLVPPATTPPPSGAPSLGGDYVSVYYAVGGVHVSPVSRPVDAGANPAEEAVMQLLAGPTPDEQRGTPAMSGVAEDTELLGLSVATGTATVDLSGEFNSPTGTSGETARLAALTFTLTDFVDIERVVLMLDGERIQYFGGHGWDITPSLSRDTFMVNQGAIDDIVITAPAWWSPVASPVTITGYATGWENLVSFALFDNEGLELAGGEVELISTGFDHGIFDWTFEYEVDMVQLGSLMVWDGSDGASAQGNLVEHAVWLYP